MAGELRCSRARGCATPSLVVTVGTPIGNLADLTQRAVEALRTADLIAAEDTRHTRALLAHAGVAAGGRFVAVHEHNERARAVELVDAIQRGRTVTLVADAGMPGIADPGHRLVRACADADLPVEVVQPSRRWSPLAARPARRPVHLRGLPAPQGPGRARERLAAIAGPTAHHRVLRVTHRVATTLGDLVTACGADRDVVLARELTKLHEEVFRGALAAALEHVEATPPAGSSCSSSPAPARDAPTDDDVAAEARAALDAGMTLFIPK